jgi:glycosyltransferase involved in cell wall biosynthesis
LRILYWHGYLLSGSGSNVVTANVTRTWRRAGHDVLLLCQERKPELLDFVDRAGDFAPDNQSFDLEATNVRGAAGTCRLARPQIGEILPVYVYDEYEGFTAKRFVDLDERELSDYVSRNVTALKAAIREHRPDAIFVNHEVMGPYIARLATENAGTYVVMLHGSALEYVVRVDERYGPYAEQGLGSARAVVGGSNYMIERASSVVSGWRDRAVVVNPGTDVDLFAPTDHPVDSPTVGFIGKLIAAKGPHNLLTAIGLTRTSDLRAVFVGYGGFEEEMRALTHAFQTGDLEAARAIAEHGEGQPLEHVLRSIDVLTSDPALRDGFLHRIGSVPIEFTGRLEHGPLSETLPSWDVLVVPSVVPEAFGMVAAEAAASGVLPIEPAHSGIAEAGAAVEHAIGRPGFLTYDPRDPVAGIADAIDRVLAVPRPQRVQMGRVASELAHATWSWDGVGEKLLAAAR